MLPLVSMNSDTSIGTLLDGDRVDALANAIVGQHEIRRLKTEDRVVALLDRDIHHDGLDARAKLRHLRRLGRRCPHPHERREERALHRSASWTPLMNVDHSQ